MAIEVPRAVRWHDDAVRIIDQTRLPGEYVELDLVEVGEVVEAIQSLRVRGAPAIGIAAAMGAVLGVRDSGAASAGELVAELRRVAGRLRTARPTAVNLRWALERMVRVAEELGLLVWAEIPVYWNIAWDHSPTLDCAKAQLGELIARDRNRCAVILWSLSNEAPATEARQAFLAELASHARSLDSTRLLTSALFARYDDDTRTMVIEDPVGEHLDVMGCNQYLGWYYREPEEMDRIRWSSPFDKPLIMSEFGAGAVAWRQGDTRTPFTEEYQAHV